jgi:hypothetical protein
MKIKTTRICLIAVIVITLFSLCLTSCNQNSTITINQNRTIIIKTALVYKMGTQPVARTKFYLLSKDLKILDEEKKSAYYTPSFIKSVISNTDFGHLIKVGIQEDKIKDYIVATTTTDFEGNAKFENVPKGTYYIGGFTTTRSEDGYVVWSVKVDATNDTQTLLLDQNNAFKAEEN